MYSFFKTLTVWFVVVTLSGCSTLQVLAFRSAPRSFQNSDQKVLLQATIAIPKNTKGSTAWPEAFPEGYPRKSCAEFPKIPEIPEIPEIKIAIAAVVPLIIGGATILLNVAFAEVGGYLERKMKEFKRTYGARINTADLTFATNERWTRCIHIQRKVGKELAIDFVVSIEPVGSDALTLRPLFLHLRKAAARTSLESGAVDIDISIAIAIVEMVDWRLSAELLTAQNFSFRAVEITGEGQPPKEQKIFEDSAIFPRPSSRKSATIAIAITETGSGAEDFGKFKKDVEANEAAIRGALTSSLTEFLRLKTK